MNSNVSVLDRMIRIILGAVLIGWAALYPGVPYAWVGWIGIIPLATGLFGWCGIYKFLGISTLQKN